MHDIFLLFQVHMKPLSQNMIYVSTKTSQLPINDKDRAMFWIYLEVSYMGININKNMESIGGKAH